MIKFNTVKILDTTFRDAHQSLLATRVKTEEMSNMIKEIDNLEFVAEEMWGGATFDSSIRYLSENPWERLDIFREGFKKTSLQMLLRGQNLVGYRNYPDDVVELFIRTMAEHGMDRVRVFDALNDFRNLKKSCEEIKKNKMHLQISIAYTTSPVHNEKYFLKLVDEAVKMETDSLCIKDMAGLLTPGRAYPLVKKIKENHPSLIIDIHSHFTTGLADMTYLKAVEAGADIIDCSISALAYGTSQPSIESLWTALYSIDKMEKPKYDILKRVNSHFEKIREKYKDYDKGVKTIKPDVLVNQIPGGMYSNLVSQLSSQGMLDKLEEVLQEVPRVRQDLGYPPLVTPTSQIVGVQAVMNVLFKERYKTITKEVENYIKGFYGSPPGEVSSELKNRILKDGNKQLNGRAADTIAPEVENGKKKLGLLNKSDEDLLIYLLFGEVGRKFLVKKYEDKLKIDFDLIYEDEVSSYPI